MRVAILLIVYGSLSLVLPLMAWGWFRLGKFLEKHPAIANEKDLDEFKRVAKFDMYLALCILACGITAGATTAVSMSLSAIKLFDILGFAPLSVAILIPAAFFTAREKRAKNLKSKNPELKDEYDHIVKTWTKKALPDW